MLLVGSFLVSDGAGGADVSAKPPRDAVMAFATVHLESLAPSAEFRARQVKLIKTFVDDAALDGTILVGDTNVEEGEDVSPLFLWWVFLKRGGDGWLFGWLFVF